MARMVIVTFYKIVPDWYRIGTGLVPDSAGLNSLSEIEEKVFNLILEKKKYDIIIIYFKIIHIKKDITNILTFLLDNSKKFNNKNTSNLEI